jgi:glycosyltransferase involved in cell wall biosynthesis
LRNTIHIWALAVTPPSVSGGDKIFLECARHWAASGYKVIIYTNESGALLIKNHQLDQVNLVLIPSNHVRSFGFTIHYIYRIFQAIFYATNLKLSTENHLFYSASDFWHDSLPAAILRGRYANSKWLAGFYFFAPSPFRREEDVQYRGGTQPIGVRSVLYYLQQRLVYPLLKSKADAWVVANELDRQILQKEGVASDKTYAIYGGVDLENSQKANAHNNESYEGCFVGRLHVQKGVKYLIPIWKEVLKALPSARLAIIGDGALEEELKNEVQKDKLEDKIFFLGYKDGNEKYSILKSSRVFLHTPLWDTGGMAAAEAMACGLPVVAFDMPGYKYSYPRGMLKAKREDSQHFAKLAIRLLKEPELYANIKSEALSFVKEWDWSARAKAIETKFSKLFNQS